MAMLCLYEKKGNSFKSCKGEVSVIQILLPTIQSENKSITLKTKMPDSWEIDDDTFIRYKTQKKNLMESWRLEG